MLLRRKPTASPIAPGRLPARPPRPNALLNAADCKAHWPTCFLRLRLNRPRETIGQALLRRTPPTLRQPVSLFPEKRVFKLQCSVFRNWEAIFNAAFRDYLLIITAISS